MKANDRLTKLIGMVAIIIIILATILIAILALGLGKDKEEGIVLNRTEVNESILQGTTKQISITAKVLGTTNENATDFVWNIDNEEIAEIVGTGNTATLTLKSGGKATVTVTYGKYTAKCNVKVTELVPRIVLSQTEINEAILKGQTKVITITATPENIPELAGTIIDNSKLKWESSNIKVAELEVNDNNTANITLRSVGEATITVSYNSIVAKCEITVKEGAQTISFDKTKVEVNKNSKYTITANVELIEEKELKWQISGSKGIIEEVEISQDKKSYTFKALQGGQVTITVMHTKSDLKATCTVNVKDVNITQTSVELNKGKTTTLTLSSYKPTGTIAWSSSDTSIATVDNTGKVTAIGSGKATITAKHKSTGLSDTCIVSVKETGAATLGIKETSVDVNKGKTAQLTITGTVSSSKVTWTSSNTSVATVDGKGVVTGVAGGTVTITATSGTLNDTCTVNVKEVDIIKENVSIYKGKTAQLTITGTISSSKVTWTSSNTSVATVDGKGVVTGVAGGTVTITATSGTLNDTCTVNVKEVDIIKESVSIYKGNTTTLTLVESYKPSGAITWKSSNTSVATVDSTGKVKGITSGTVTITATIGSLSDTCTVKVIQSASASLGIKETSVDVNKGKTVQLTKTGTVSSSSVTWSSSDTRIATVSSSGVVTGVKGGTVTITATSGALSDTCTVNVKDVNIDMVTLEMYKGDTETLLLLDYKPSGTITWTSSNTSVVTVDNGHVVAVGLGEATITAKHTTSGMSDICSVKVVEVNIAKDVYIIYKGKTVTVNLSNYKPSTITWSSSNTSVATVSTSGVVTGVAGGPAIITAKDRYGKSDTCRIMVLEKGVQWVDTASPVIAGGNQIMYSFKYDKYVTISFKTSDSTVLKVTGGDFNDPNYATVHIQGVKKGTAYLIPQIKINNVWYELTDKKILVTVKDL